MKTTVIRLLIAVVLAGAAWLSWSESRLAAEVADARQSIATFDYDDADSWTPRAALSDYVARDGRTLSDEIRVAKASVAYWLGRYDAVAADTNDAAADAEVLLATANAAFRLNQRDPGTGPSAVQRLDGVLQAYAAALKASPRNVEAAYNYEFVARLRDHVARSQGKMARPAAGGPIMAGDLPAGATIHGGPGAPPPETKMEELQTIAPMEYGDREAQPEPTPGVRRERKG